jgi:hypothetical protein
MVSIYKEELTKLEINEAIFLKIQICRFLHTEQTQNLMRLRIKMARKQQKHEWDLADKRQLSFMSFEEAPWDIIPVLDEIEDKFDDFLYGLDCIIALLDKLDYNEGDLVQNLIACGLQFFNCVRELFSCPEEDVDNWHLATSYAGHAWDRVVRAYYMLTLPKL